MNKIPLPIRVLWMMLTVITWLGFICSVCNISCQKSPQHTGQQPVAETRNPPAKEANPLDVKRVDVALDSIPGAVVSTARNIYLILDGSGSMDKACTGQNRKIDDAKAAVKEYLKRVPDDVNLGIYIFDAKGWKERVPIGGKNKDSILAAVNAADAGNNTPLCAAICYAADRLVEQYKKQLGYGEYRIVVVTDGAATDGNERELARSVSYAAQYGFPIYTIGLCIGNDHPLYKYSASYRAATNAADLQKGLEETLAEPESYDATTFENK